MLFISCCCGWWFIVAGGMVAVVTQWWRSGGLVGWLFDCLLDLFVLFYFVLFFVC